MREFSDECRKVLTRVRVCVAKCDDKSAVELWEILRFVIVRSENFFVETVNNHRRVMT